MPALARQRCLHHTAREAVARCPECGQFFCRECITEHDDRVICAACLKKLAPAAAPRARWRVNLWPLFQASGGFALAWLIFYTLGRLLLALPDEFHGDQLWQGGWMDSFQTDADE